MPLSAEDRRLYAEIVPLALEYERRLLGALDPDEHALLERVLRKLGQHVAVS